MYTSARPFCSKQSGCCDAVIGSAASGSLLLSPPSPDFRASHWRTLPWLPQHWIGWGDGIDFADALHLVKARGCEAFVSFDQRFAAVANALSEVKVRVP